MKLEVEMQMLINTWRLVKISDGKKIKLSSVVPEGTNGVI